MLFRSSLQSHESTETSTWYEKIVLPHGCCFQWVFFLVMRWKNTLLMNASFGTTSSSHLEINLVGPSQIESSSGSLSDLLTSNLEQFVLLFKGSESMKFYTHHISSGWKSWENTNQLQWCFFFLGENGPSDFQPQNKRLVHCLGWC